MLLDAGANVNAQGGHCVQAASDYGHMRVVGMLRNYIASALVEEQC